MGLMVPAERSGALSREPYEVCQNCVQSSWTSRNMVDAFLKLREREQASLTCWNLRGPQQNTAKCSDPQRSLVNLGQHERTQRTLQYIGEPVRTVEKRRETL